jgi:Membrane proteins related to metalloendopeptidases
MIMRMRYIVIGLSLLVVSWIGSKTYTYFFDSSMPALQLLNLEDNKYYSGDMQCAIASTKSGDVSIWLDDQSLVNQCRLSASSYGHQFTIPTKTISNGKHTLRANLTDHTYTKNSVSLERSFYVDNVSLQAALIKSDADFKVLQGRTLHVQFQVNKEIKDAKFTALSNTYVCFPESKNSSIYEAYIPISCEENPNEYLFSIDIVDHVGNAMKLDNKFQVVMFPFKKQNLTISQEKIKHEEEIGINNIQFEERIARLTESSPKEKLWKGTFCAPVEIQRISCDFGTVRTTQHKGRYAHKALDVTNAPKSVVWATQDGIVVMKERFAGSGHTVIIDHGMGILSMFFHLEDYAKIEVGQKVAKGNPVGYIGKTGYATGYHLHWEMRVNNMPVDPMQWTKPIL